jgi:hypothetical protein
MSCFTSLSYCCFSLNPLLLLVSSLMWFCSVSFKFRVAQSRVCQTTLAQRGLRCLGFTLQARQIQDDFSSWFRIALVKNLHMSQSLVLHPSSIFSVHLEGEFCIGFVTGCPLPSQWITFQQKENGNPCLLRVRDSEHGNDIARDIFHITVSFCSQTAFWFPISLRRNLGQRVIKCFAQDPKPNKWWYINPSYLSQVNGKLSWFSTFTWELAHFPKEGVLANRILRC